MAADVGRGGAVALEGLSIAPAPDACKCKPMPDNGDRFPCHCGGVPRADDARGVIPVPATAVLMEQSFPDARAVSLDDGLADVEALFARMLRDA